MQNAMLILSQARPEKIAQESLLLITYDNSLPLKFPLSLSLFLSLWSLGSVSLSFSLTRIFTLTESPQLALNIITQNNKELPLNPSPPPQPPNLRAQLTPNIISPNNKEQRVSI